jgi:hypothetical protein
VIFEGGAQFNAVGRFVTEARVQSRGSIVLGTGRHLYDRYVTSCQFCFDTEYLLPSWVEPADNPHCFVDYHCDTRTSIPERSGHGGCRGPPR